MENQLIVRCLGSVGSPSDALTVDTMVQAQTRMLVLGVVCDSLVYELPVRQLMGIETAIVARATGDGRIGMQFRGCPAVTHPDLNAHVGRLIVPPSPYNDAAGMTGCYVEIASR